MIKIIKHLESVKYLVVAGVFFIANGVQAIESFLPIDDVSGFGCSKVYPIERTDGERSYLEDIKKIGGESVECDDDVEITQILGTGAGAGTGTGVGAWYVPYCAPQILCGIAMRKRVKVYMPEAFVNIKTETFPPFSPEWKPRDFGAVI